MRLIPAPILDIRDEEQLAAEAIAYVSGGLTVERIDKIIEIQRRLREMVAGGTLPQPACPELTNANPSSPHTALLEAQAWLLAFVVRRINLLPERDQIEFARLFGIELREATQATATLEFTAAPPGGAAAIIPVGTEVGTEDEEIVFETTEVLEIPPGSTTGTVAARRVQAGETTLAADTLIVLRDAVQYVSGVTNPDPVDSGSEKEPISEALHRARNYQRRGERLVTEKDIEDAIREEVLAGNGIVRAFPFIKDGEWETLVPGHTTVVVMTRAGAPVSPEIKQRINLLLKQSVGNQFIYIKDPTYVDFNVEADIRTDGLIQQNGILAAIERNLKSVYDATARSFGRPILRSEIIAVIEETPGVDRIEAQPGGAILASPLVDIDVAPYEMPRLLTVTMHVI